MDTDIIQRWKATAEVFLKDDVKAFIKDVSGDLYFCDILLVGEDSIRIECFNPPQRKGKKFTLYWTLITEFNDYRQKEEVI